jgi:hypothetical protein
VSATTDDAVDESGGSSSGKGGETGAKAGSGEVLASVTASLIRLSSASGTAYSEEKGGGRGEDALDAEDASERREWGGGAV